MKHKSLITGFMAVAAVLLAAGLGGCNSSGCTENRNALPLAEFYNSATGRAIGLDSLQISGVDAPGDSVLSAPGPSITQVYLPMRPTETQTVWCIAYKWRELDYPELNDTITFDYQTEPYFASEECGATYRYRITEMAYTEHLIDSVVIVDPLITNIDKAYFRIYFRGESDNPDNQPDQEL